MNYAKHHVTRILFAGLFVSAGCTSEEGELEQHAKACESRCAEAQTECAADAAFADPWQLACEVACNLDFSDEAHPFEACMDAAVSCAAKDACVDGGPSVLDDGGTDGDDDDDAGATTMPQTSDDDGTDSTGVDPTAAESSSGGVDGHPCCDVSGTACSDPGVLECTCGHLPGCCSGVWGEVCTSVAVANGCIDEGCSTLAGWDEWQCSCSTIDVFCPDDPFVGQIIFSTDACGLSEGDALAIATEACEQGDGECEIGIGSCDCTCSNFGDSCAPE